MQWSIATRAVSRSLCRVNFTKMWSLSPETPGQRHLSERSHESVTVSGVCNKEKTDMIFAARLAEVPLWGKKLITVNGEEVVLINDKGNIFACENYCPHQGSTMLAGIVKEGVISCPRHGWSYNLDSGACTNHPGYTLKTY
jgi:nitrite reductase/ring-hydroxylating ferredoxin subunit